MTKQSTSWPESPKKGTCAVALILAVAVCCCCLYPVSGIARAKRNLQQPATANAVAALRSQAILEKRSPSRLEAAEALGVRPEAIRVTLVDGVMSINMGGGFAHYGLVATDPGAPVSSVSFGDLRVLEVVPGVWFYED
ncbi:MAG: hypothetical protein JKY65_21010 [Planctomycetes bacterium]|nr:hypothetical protein [Planctomycetota bacterium]